MDSSLIEKVDVKNKNRVPYIILICVLIVIIIGLIISILLFLNKKKKKKSIGMNTVGGVNNIGYGDNTTRIGNTGGTTIVTPTPIASPTTPTASTGIVNYNGVPSTVNTGSGYMGETASTGSGYTGDTGSNGSTPSTAMGYSEDSRSEYIDFTRGSESINSGNIGLNNDQITTGSETSNIINFIPGKSISNIPNSIIFSDNIWIDAQGRTGNNIQAKVDEIYNLQSENEFGDQRYALLFKPGIYNVKIRVGYYTTVLGLGRSKNDVIIIGNIQSLQEKTGSGPGFLNRFWRGCENLTVKPDNNMMLWGVSQASHIRSVSVRGNLFLALDPGWSSGGFMSDCEVDNEVRMQTQQQFFVRNTKYNNIGEGAWNIQLMGNDGITLGNQDCNVKNKGALYTVIDKTPIIAQKPYLFIENGVYQINKPSVQTDKKGLLDNTTFTIPSSQIFVALPTHSASTINAAIRGGFHILLTPGIYKLMEPIRVSRSGVVILGIGLATLQPVNGTSALIVENNSLGVRLAGFMVQAGNNGSLFLIQIGTMQNTGGSATDPTILSDVYCRVGGPNDIQNVDTMLVVNQKYVVIDGVWLWRADHTKEKKGGLGADKAISNHCLVVNADYVITYGLHVEHALKELILWNGNYGRIYFIQSELAYDVPASWDYPALRIGNNVTYFYGIGLGFYTFFSKSTHPNEMFPNVTTAIITPETPGIIIKSAFTLLLNKNEGAGSIKHVINNRGGVSDSSNADIPVWCSLNANNFCQC